MANKKIIITRTVQYPGEKGLVTLTPSDEPQSIDSALAAEGLERGWAKEPPKAKKAEPEKAPAAKKAPAKKAPEPSSNPDDEDQSGNDPDDGAATTE